MIKGVIRGERRPPRMSFYGPPKIGKSTLAADMPNPIFITTEDGIDGIDVDRFPRATTWAELLEQVNIVSSAIPKSGIATNECLAGEPDTHDYKTLVIDTLNGAVELASQHVCKTLFKDNWGDGGFNSYGKGWAATSEEMRKMLVLLDMARQKGIMICLLAHTGIQSVKNPDGTDYSKYAPDIDKKVWARFSAWSDIIGRCEYQHSIVTNRDGKGKAVSTTTRLIHFSGSQSEDAGCRVGYELPAELPLSWQEIEKHLGKKSDVAEQVKKLWQLFPQEKQAKVLAYLGINTISEIEKAQSQKAATVLNDLQKRAAEAAQKEGN
jgi:hypothetical protein